MNRRCSLSVKRILKCFPFKAYYFNYAMLYNFYCVKISCPEFIWILMLCTIYICWWYLPEENWLSTHHHPVARQPLMGQDLLAMETSRSHSDTRHSVGLLWTSDQPDAETSTWQDKTQDADIHVPGGIRTHIPSKRTAADRRLRARGHWDRQMSVYSRSV
jgi:hypothetical protein